MPNQSEGEFNPTQAHFWYLIISILAIVAQKMKIFHFCFHHLKDEDKPQLEQLLTQITKWHYFLCILLYSATFKVILTDTRLTWYGKKSLID